MTNQILPNSQAPEYQPRSRVPETKTTPEVEPLSPAVLAERFSVVVAEQGDEGLYDYARDILGDPDDTVDPAERLAVFELVAAVQREELQAQNTDVTNASREARTGRRNQERSELESDDIRARQALGEVVTLLDSAVTTRDFEDVDSKLAHVFALLEGSNEELGRLRRTQRQQLESHEDATQHLRGHGRAIDEAGERVRSGEADAGALEVIDDQLVKYAVGRLARAVESTEAETPEAAVEAMTAQIETMLAAAPKAKEFSDAEAMAAEADIAGLELATTQIDRILQAARSERLAALVRADEAMHHARTPEDRASAIGEYHRKVAELIKQVNIARNLLQTALD